MTWEIFLGIASLSAFMISFMGIAVKVTKILTSVQISLDDLNKSMKEAREKNEKEHINFNKRINANEKAMFVHTQKIKNIERM